MPKPARRQLPAPDGYVTDAIATLRAAPKQIRAALLAHRDRLDATRRIVDQDVTLSDEGRRQRFAAEAKRSATTATAAVDQIIAQAQDAADTLTRVIDRAKPDRVGGVEGMLGRQAAWARVRELLAAGLTMRQIIDEATDPETLHAIADELPTWLRIQTRDADNAATALDTYRLRLDRRFAEIAPDQEAANALAALAARHDLVTWPMVAEQARRGAAETNPGRVTMDLGTALAIRLAHAQAAGADTADDGVTEG